MAEIRINQLPSATGGGAPVPSDVVPIDGATTRKATIKQIVEVGRPVATQAQAEAGTDAEAAMTPLTTAQQVTALGPTLLNLKAASHMDVGDSAGTVAAGDDARIINGDRALTEVRDIWYNVKRSGISMAGTVADTQKFLDMLSSIGSKSYFLPAGELWLNQTVNLSAALSGTQFLGASREKTKIICKTSLSSMFNIQNGCNGVIFENIEFIVSGFSTPAFLSTYVSGQSSSEFRFINCTFTGNTAGDLTRFGLFGDGYDFENCVWNVSNSSLWGMTLDTGPHNMTIRGGRMYGHGGAGNGLRIIQSDPANGAAHRVEWLNISGGFEFLTGGGFAMQVGPSLGTSLVGVCVDQFTDTGVQITGNSGSGADLVVISDCYFGSAGNVGVGFTELAGNGARVSNNTFNNLQYGVYIGATASKISTGHAIQGNYFANIAKSSVVDDSSAASIEGNTTLFSAVTEGAYHFKATNGGAGQPSFSGNNGITSIVRDAGVPVPAGAANVGAGSWVNHRSVSLHLSAPQSIPSGVPTDVVWSAEDYDPMNCHVPNTPGIVIQAGMSVCEFNFLALWAANSLGNRAAELWVNVSGSNIVIVPLERQAFGSSYLTATIQTAVAPGQIWFLRVYQDGTAGAGALDLAVGSYLQMKVLG